MFVLKQMFAKLFVKDTCTIINIIQSIRIILHNINTTQHISLKK